MNEPLASATVRGTLWVTIGRIFSIGFQTVTTAVLARLLVPADFGIVQAALILTQVIGVINDLGLSATIIRHRDLSQEQISAIYWLSIASGFLAWGICTAGAPLAGWFFGHEQVPRTLRIIALVFILDSLMSVHRSQATGALRFGTIGMLEMVATLVSGSSAVLLAIEGAGVYSLAWGQVINSLTLTLLWWAVWRWRPSFTFRLRGIRLPMRFGLSAMGSSLVNVLSGNVDNAILGRSLGAEALGYYSQGWRWAMAAYHQLGGVFNRVLFPVFSNIQDTPSRLQRGYLKATTYIALLVFPIAAGLSLVAPEFVTLMYGTGWEAIVMPMRLLSLASMAYGIGTLVGPVCFACGRPDILLKFNLAKIGIVGTIAVLAARFGIVAVSAGMVIWAWGALLVLQRQVNRLIGLSMKAYIRALYLPGAATLAMTLVAVMVRLALLRIGVSNLFLLPAVIILGGMVYGAGLLVLGRAELYGLVSIGRDALSRTLVSRTCHHIECQMMSLSSENKDAREDQDVSSRVHPLSSDP